MWYWAIYFSNTVPRPFVADMSDLKGLDDRDFMQGKRIENWNSEAWLQATKAENDGEPDDVLSNLHALPVFSGRVRNRLEEIGIGGIQYLPVRVLRSTGMEVPGFSIGNTLNLVPALDFEKSEIEYFPDDYFRPEKRGQARDIRTAILRSSALRGLDIVRLAEFPVATYVSERFKEEFERKRFTGWSFRPVRVVTS